MAGHAEDVRSHRRTETSVSAPHRDDREGGRGGGGGVTTMHSPQADTQYACLHVTLQDVHSVGPSEGPLSGSPDT